MVHLYVPVCPYGGGGGGGGECVGVSGQTLAGLP